MKVADALRRATAQLGTDWGRDEAELLMAHAFGISRSDLLLRYQDHTAPERFFDGITRRAAHEPLAHIIGSEEFYGRNFLVTPDTLIPRADSETLIRAALETARAAKRVLDLGTGSGALLLTFLAETGIAGARTPSLGVGIDRSNAALDVARENASRLSVEHRVRFGTVDWTKPGWTKSLGSFDLILCNPPYVEDNAELDASVRDFEPAGALFAGAEGLDDYRLLIPHLPGLLIAGGLAIFEIGYRQAATVTAMAKAAGFTVELRRDLAGRDRALILRIKGLANLA